MKDLQFHYNKEERLALSTASRNKSNTTPKKSFFKKNSLLFIILIDILLISIILLFNKGVIRLPAGNPPSRQEHAGYSFILRGLQLKDKLIASLTIKKLVMKSVSTSTVYLRFIGRDEVVLSSAELPAIKNEEQEITATLFEPAGNQILKVEITWGEEIFILSRKITNE